MITEINNEYYFSEAGTPHSKLPLGVYLLRYDSMRQVFYLSKTSDFNLPSKMYGDFSIVDRWLKTYEEKKAKRKNLGVLLSGVKGAGKTLTAELLCKKANQPVIMIRSAFVGEGFETFMTNPELGDCTIFIDEFEKTYNGSTSDGQRNASTSDGQRNAGEGLLQLLDGGYTTSHLFIFTVNDQSKMNDFLMNRPSRIYYRSDYSELPEDVIREVGQDRGLSEDDINDLLICAQTLGNNASFDSLISIIEEAKRFGETPSKAAKYLNFKRESSSFSMRIEVENLETGVVERDYKMSISMAPGSTFTQCALFEYTQSRESWLEEMIDYETDNGEEQISQTRIDELAAKCPEALRRKRSRYINIFEFDNSKDLQDFYFKYRKTGRFEYKLTKEELIRLNNDSTTIRAIKELKLENYRIWVEIDPYKDYGRAF